MTVKNAGQWKMIASQNETVKYAAEKMARQEVKTWGGLRWSEGLANDRAKMAGQKLGQN